MCCSLRWFVGLCCLLALAGAAVAGTYQVGVAPPSVKVMIEGGRQGWPFEGWTADHYDLNLARNEHEAMQVVVMATDALSNVQVSVSSLQPVGGGAAFNGTAAAWLVGHVDVADDALSDLNVQYPEYLVDYHGWFPDPLLTFTNHCSINAGDRVAFWVDVATRADTPAGDYVATITVTASDSATSQLQLNVHVWDFTVPAAPSLPTAFSCDLWMVKSVYGSDYDTKQVEQQFWDMQLAHRMSITHIYRDTPEPYGNVAYWAPRNETMFNLVNASNISRVTSSSLASLVAQLTAAGRLDMGYLYGFDEATQDKFPTMYDVFTEAHSRYPTVPTMTTAGDMSFGTSSSTSYLREAVDIWVPITPYYDKVEAQRLRAEGKDMWWYVAVGPRHPYANFLIEYSAIEGRLLMGLMAYKYQVGGFLYYSVANWPTDWHLSPIASGPYTSWDPRTILHPKGWADGDGSLFCAGPNGPIPTIRLENIRDGLEDYEYLKLLGDLVKRVSAGCPTSPEVLNWLNEARDLLVVPSSLVSSVATYTHDTVALESFRRQVAESIIAGTPYAVGLPPDSDGDGVGDPCDNCVNVSNPDQANIDRDALGDACDPDRDGDGVADVADNCPAVSNAGQQDRDQDRVGDACDICPDEPDTDQADADHDGWGDACDDCPNVSNAGQADVDRDGWGDACDNCPSMYNPDQADSDSDGIGNVCDHGMKWLDEEFDGALIGDDKTGSWDAASMLARWPLTWGSSGGAFTAGKGLMPSPGAAMDTKKLMYRMTANLELNQTAGYGSGNDGIGAMHVVNGTDADPLILQFAVDFNADAFGGRANFYMELSYDDGSGDDSAPRSGMATEDLDPAPGDQGPWTDYTVHRALAFGSFAGVNVPGDPDAGGSKGACMFYDGTRWHYKSLRDIADQSATLWKRQDGGLSIFKMTIKTHTVILECDNRGAYPTSNTPHEVARAYFGPFNRLSMVMGNTLVTGKVNYVDEIELRDGTLSLVFPPDFDEDGDVDMEDFGFFQACLSGTAAPAAGCAPADFDRDNDVDADDMLRMERCISGPGESYSPGCF